MILPPVYIINLDKDKQRLKDSLKEFKKISSKSCKRISGVYGKNLSQKELKTNTSGLFTKFGSRSAIGCAMSHVKAWKTMLKNKDKTALIIEDDIMFHKNFKQIFKKIKVPEDFHILYLGCTVGCDPRKNYEIDFPFSKLILANGYTKQVKRINEHVYVPALPLALHGYILSEKGAKYLIEHVEKDNIFNHIDAQILNYIYNVPSYATDPQLIKQGVIDVETSNNIQGSYPLIINNQLTFLDKNNVPFNYKLAIYSYNVLGYKITAYLPLFFTLGIISGLAKIRKNYVFMFFLIFNYLELMEISKHNPSKNDIKIFIINSIVSLAIFIFGYLLTISMFKS